jgi:guanylate kinase
MGLRTRIWRPGVALRSGAGPRLTEATAFAIRIDVAEELTRLSSHLDEIERLIAQGGEVGKRLDFLIQELHREANTLGSKSSAAGTDPDLGGHESTDRADARAGTKHRITTLMDYPGNLFVVAAPSGAGKSSLGQGADGARFTGAAVGVAHHPPPRGQEKHGREYFFVSQQEFDAMVLADAFVEWAHVHGQRYGTSKKPSKIAFARADVILEIDFQGAIQIKKIFANAVLVFILPPSWEELSSRLERRGEDTSEVIELRLRNAALEMAQATGIRLRYNQ